MDGFLLNDGWWSGWPVQVKVVWQSKSIPSKTWNWCDDVFLFLQQNAKNKGSTWRTFALLSLFPFVAILFHDVRWAWHDVVWCHDWPTDRHVECSRLRLLVACCLNRLLEILHHYNRASTVCNISSIYNSIYNIFNLLVSSQATKKERKEQLKRHFNHLFISINTASIDWLTPFELSTYKFQIHFHCNNHVTVHLYNHSHQNRNHVLKIMLASFCISDGCFHHCSSLYYYYKKYCSPSRHRLP